MVSGPDESAGDSFFSPLPFQLKGCVPEERLRGSCLCFTRGGSKTSLNSTDLDLLSLGLSRPFWGGACQSWVLEVRVPSLHQATLHFPPKED